MSSLLVIVSEGGVVFREPVMAGEWGWWTVTV